MKRRWLVPLVATAALVIPGMTMAYGVHAANTVTVPKGETRVGTFYAAGSTITIDGDIQGDLVCAGSIVNVSGAVHGDVLCAGQSVTVNGPVDGSVRAAGQVVTLNGSIGRNAMVAAQSLMVTSTARVGGDIGVLAQSGTINGSVEKTAYGMLDILTLGGTVGSVDARLNHLNLGAGGRVTTDVRYTSEDTFTLNKGQIGGEIVRSAPRVSLAEQRATSPQAELAKRLYWIFATTLLGLVLAWLAPALVGRVSRTLWEHPRASLGWGALMVLVGPIVAIGLVFTIIGIPLAVVAGAILALLLGISPVFAGIGFGQWLLRRLDWKPASLAWSALAGIPFCVIVLSLPVVGKFLAPAIGFWAVGGMVLSARALREAKS